MSALSLTAQPQQLFALEVQLSDMKRRAVGAAGERVARLLLERSGYEVATTGRGERRGDLLVIDPQTGESWRVEVKTSRRGARGLWKFNLVKPGHTDCKDADFVLLLAVLKSGRAVPFLVPVSAFGSLKTFQFKSHPHEYAGRFAQYRQGGGGVLRLEEPINEGG